jgi:hypothetical protein
VVYNGGKQRSGQTDRTSSWEYTIASTTAADLM